MADTKELVERLRKIADASRRADGTDIPLGQELREAADAIERLKRERDEAVAQIVSAREECPLVRRQDYFGTPLPALVAAQVSELFGWQSRAEAAEAELTTLRARLAKMEEALTFASGAFETIRLNLVHNLNEPERSAFWGAVQARTKVDAALTEEQP